MGAKDTFTKYVFGFFESFRPRLTSKFARRADMKIFFLQKCSWVFKNAEIDADIESVEIAKDS